MSKEHNTPFESLDPQDWAQARQLMHQMVDDAFDHVQHIRERKIWQEMPQAIKDKFKSSVPADPSNASDVYEALKTDVLPYPMGNVHPRFWAWYMGSGTISGAVGDFWTSIFNPNMGGGSHAGYMVEAQVVNWMKEVMHFPKSSSGILVSGGSMANFNALAVARHVKAGYDIRKEGIRPEYAGKFTVYASVEVHSCNQKAVELLGMGSDSLRKIKVNEDYTIDINALKNQIKTDRKNGFIPICIIGTSGTVNTGAIDDLHSLADICQAENMWFHVDGAIGAIGMLSDEVAKELSGIERADSVALDLHKWMHMPFEAGCVLIKDQAGHKDTFSLIPAYLAKNTRGVASGDHWFSEYGLQLSRRFRALKIWMSLKEHGTKKFGRMIHRNVQQAKYLEKLINQNPLLELVAPVGLDIVCFRYNPGNKNHDELNSLNKEIKLQLEERAIALPGYTTLQDKYCIRVAISNHRTRNEDLDALIEGVMAIGQELV